MDLENIQKKEFHIVFKGYKPEEVDEFLDTLAIEFEKLRKANLELQNVLDKRRSEESEDSVEMKKVIQDTLVSAHKVAEDIKQKAKIEAEEMVKEAVAKEEESYKDLLSKKTQLEKDISALSEDYKDFKKKISGMIDEFRELTDKAERDKILNINEPGDKNLDVGKIMMGKEFEEDKEIDIKEKGFSLVEELEAEDNREREAEENKAEEEAEQETGKEKEKAEEEEVEKYTGEEKAEEEAEQEVEKEKEKDNTQDIGEQKDSQSDEEEVEEDDDYKPKRVKKKIDIANPDIINDFFKTDED